MIVCITFPTSTLMVTKGADTLSNISNNIRAILILLLYCLIKYAYCSNIAVQKYYNNIETDIGVILFPR